jgi:DNA polymerase III alpha subunit (gram-positive type)
MLEISSAMSYAKLDEPKDYSISKKIWNRLKAIYGGDDNVLRDKSKIIKGKFYDMRMMEGENVVQ